MVTKSEFATLLSREKIIPMETMLTRNNERPYLKVVPNIEERKITIKDNVYAHPFSWFITNSSGELSKSGRVVGREMIISVPDLEDGIYHFRAQGEIYEFNLDLAI